MTASASPRRRLAPRTSSQQPAPRTCNGFKTTFNHTLKRLYCGPLIQPLTHTHHYRRQLQPKKHLPNQETLFNIHNPSQDHRDRGACGFLLTS